MTNAFETNGDQNEQPGFLDGIRVLEVANELGEYCGKVLAGLGADVVKVEPPDGEETRHVGPFRDDSPDIEGSLYFWNYNLGKRGIALDLEAREGQETFRQLADSADVVLDTRPNGYMDGLGLGYDALCQSNEGLVYAAITPFGEDGPWAEFKGSDLVHLGLGGVVMNCGYDPEPDGHYELPPMAPQMWQAYHIAGEMAAIGIVGALCHRLETGRGQRLSTAVHQAVSANTECDIPDWVFQRIRHRRQTARHSWPEISAPWLSRTKDGRWLLPYHTYLPAFAADPVDATIRVLRRHDLDPLVGGSDDPLADQLPDGLASEHIETLTDTLISSYLYSRDLWIDGQAEGLPWAPCRRPEENGDDEHFRSRNSVATVEHPELGTSYRYAGAKWRCAQAPWRVGPRAPRLGEHTAEVLAEKRTSGARVTTSTPQGDAAPLSARGKRFPLSGVRVIDLSWMLASAGGGRFLASLGAEVIKVEHESRWDGMRFCGIGVCPDGGRSERERAEEPIPSPPVNGDPDRTGMFAEVNSGKLSASLNLKSERGMELLIELLKDADMVLEGFSPGTMERLGLGYERLREINPRLIYIQQSGMGQVGSHGSLKSYGPTGAAISGLTEMSGLPEPFEPAGIGYSYLDWFGAYNLALASMAALHRQRTTGEGCWVDSSQAEAGIYLTGTAILDHSVNGRSWQRYGNRSPYKPAAPHGVYPVQGDDRWIAISCFTDDEWRALGATLGGDLDKNPDFDSQAKRIAGQDELDDAVAAATADWDGFELMAALQAAGVAAGVCQTAEDRCDYDPQLKHLGWQVELSHREIGTWPVKEFPVHFSETPPYIGGLLDRNGPCYAQDNDYVFGRLLGLDDDERAGLEEKGVLSK